MTSPEPMPTLTVRDIPERVYKRLAEHAKLNRRSMSAEVVFLLEEALIGAPVDAEAIIAEAEEVHALFPEPLPDLIAEGIRESRKYEDDLE